MSKAYYWLKLKKDFFDDPKILKIRSVAGGDTYTCIYLKLLLKSLDNDGVIFFDGIEPTIEAEIALKIREQEINVKAAMAIFESLGLLQKRRRRRCETSRSGKPKWQRMRQRKES